MHDDDPYIPEPDKYDYIRESDGHAIAKRQVPTMSVDGTGGTTTVEVDMTVLLRSVPTTGTDVRGGEA